MDWEKIDSTVRQSYRKNGREMEINRGRNPLSELIAKDPTADLDEMTSSMLYEFATLNHIAIPGGLDREELLEAIRSAQESNWEERTVAMRRLLDYLFADGPHPVCVYRRAVAIAKEVRPKCVREMSLADIAVLSGDGNGRTSDGRATVSARIKRLCEQPIKKMGMLGFKAAFQKTQASVETYSSVQKGNQNRLGRDYLELHGKNGASRTGLKEKL